MAEPCAQLEPVKYVYQRAGERIFKVVTFWVMAAVGGELGAIAEEMRVEVAEVAWVPLADAPQLLAYRGEQRLVDRPARRGVARGYPARAGVERRCTSRPGVAAATRRRRRRRRAARSAAARSVRRGSARRAGRGRR